MIELLEYVLRKGARPEDASVSPGALGGLNLLAEAELNVRVDLVPVTRRLPLITGGRVDDPEEMVSNEFVPISDGAADAEIGAGGVSGSSISAGASKPFLVVLAAREVGMLNRFFALGADATRRINRAAAFDFLSAFESEPRWPR